MKTIALCLLTLPLYGQITSFSGVNGLGHSTYVCKDRDGDGYGVGIRAVVNTTSLSSIAAGTQNVTPVSMTGTITGTLTSGSNIVTNVNVVNFAYQVGETIASASNIPGGTTISAIPPRPPFTGETGTLTMSANAINSGTFTLSIGIAAGSVLAVDISSNMEKIVVASATSSTFTATFLVPHAGGVIIRDQGCLGPDADDSDVTVWTAVQASTKWGNSGTVTQATLTKYYQHLGYAATGNFYFVDYTHGTDAGGATTPNCQNNISAPCQNYSYFRLALIADSGANLDDVIVFRDGPESRIDLIQGGLGHPMILVAYPGETPELSSCLIASTTVQADDQSNWTIDGFRVACASEIGGGTTSGGSSTPTAQNVEVKNIEAIDAPNSLQGVIQCFNGCINWNIHDNVTHDDNIGHGMYNGSRELVSGNFLVHGNIIYNHANVGIQWNARCTAPCAEYQNLIYNVDGAGIDNELGPSNMQVYDNVIFGTGSAEIQFQEYNGSSAASNCGPGFPAGSLPCCPPGMPQNIGGICPYSINNAAVYNNTLYNTGHSGYDGSNSSGNPGGISMAHSGMCTTSQCIGTNFNSNSFYNNVIVVYTSGTQFPFLFAEHDTGDGQECISGTNKCSDWFATSTFSNNVAFYSDGSGDTHMFYGPVSSPLTCAAAASLTTITGPCLIQDPKYINASTSLFNVPWQFDLRLGLSSPALHTGTLTGIPGYDWAGRAYMDDSPSMGALERNPYNQGWNALSTCIGVKWDNTTVSGEGCGYTGNITPPNGAPLDTLNQPITSSTQTSIVVNNSYNGNSYAEVGNLFLINNGSNSELICINGVALNTPSTGLTTITSGNNSQCTTVTGAATGNGRGWGGTTAQSSLGTSGTTIYYNPMSDTGIQAVNPSGVYPFASKSVAANCCGAGRDGIGRDIPGKPKEMCFYGGGHSDYGGDEVTCVDFNRVVPKISVVKGSGPSPMAIPGYDVYDTFYYSTSTTGNIGSQLAAQFKTGGKGPPHIPGDVIYNPWEDKVYAYGGGYWGTNGLHGYDSHWFDFADNKWHQFDGSTSPSAISTTGTASSGSTSLTVASGAGIIAGMTVYGAGIPLWDQVASGSGTSWTLAFPTTAALSGTPLTFAYSDVDCTNYGAGPGTCSSNTPGNPVDIFSFGQAGAGFSSGASLADPTTQTIWQIWSFSTTIPGWLTQHYTSKHQHVLRNTNMPLLECCTTPGDDGHSRVFIADKRWFFINSIHGGSHTGNYGNFVIDVYAATSTTPTASPNPNSVQITLDSSCSGWYSTVTAGMVWNKAISQIVAYPQGTGGNTYYTMLPPPTIAGTWPACQSFSPSGGPPTVTDNQMLGGYMQYFDSTDATFVMDDVGANVPRVLSLNPPDPGGVVSCTVSLSPSSPGPYTVGQTISTITATANNCGVTASLIWTLSSLPTGLSHGSCNASATCLITGTVTAANTFSTSISVTDGGSNTGSNNPTILVNAAPVITTTSPLNPGVVGTPFSQTLMATGGTAPLAWSITSGAPATGLTLNSSTGVLSGTPSAPGVFTFAALVTDANGISGSKSLQQTITGASSPEASSVFGVGKMGPGIKH
jgi:hypothetical protein